jgi:murein DD-endopeptidase MepM/ murein hydrolase activator NlpD
MDTTVYFETLDQYQCNPALYIKAEAGTEVKSVYQGKIMQIQKDDRLGNLVTVDIGNGYQVTYGQLDEVSLQEGDSVETGSVIGKVAEPTDYFLLEGSHLYFQMTKENEPVNPTDYFAA